MRTRREGVNASRVCVPISLVEHAVLNLLQAELHLDQVVHQTTGGGNDDIGLLVQGSELRAHARATHEEA